MSKNLDAKDEAFVRINNLLKAESMLISAYAQGNPVEGVYCDIVQMADEEQHTDLLGKAAIIGIKSGTFTLSLSKEGLATQSQNFTIKRGQKLKLVVVMG